MRFTEQEREFNKYVMDLGVMGGMHHAGPMMQLKDDCFVGIPYTYQTDLEPCVDCWVRYGGMLEMWALKHDCCAVFE